MNPMNCNPPSPPPSPARGEGIIMRWEARGLIFRLQEKEVMGLDIGWIPGLSVFY